MSSITQSINYRRRYAMQVLSGELGFREDFPDPSGSLSVRNDRRDTYNQMLAYYNNTAFDDVSKWARYKLKYNLYQYTRNIFNPVARVVDFYVDHVYPGVLSIDGKELPNGVQSAIPLSHDTDTKLAQAIGETWKNSNWQSKSGLMVKFGGLTGNCLIEVVDDLVLGQVRYKPIWSGHVAAFEVNDSGDLDAYVLEYEAIDRTTGEIYLFGKEVQAGFIAYYKNRQLNYVVENPYGFVPAVWVLHDDFGSDFGIPAIGNSRGKIDEVNSLASHTSDHIHKQIDSPRVLWSTGVVKPLFAQDTDDPAYDGTGYGDSRREVLMLKGPKEGHTETLVGTLDAATIVPIIREMLDEIRRDYPEITMYEMLRKMSQVTGPAASKMMGDVDNKLRRPAANYDNASVKLFAMGVGISGFRANSGAWGPISSLSKGQQKFLEFGLGVYYKGELQATILPRPLVTESTKDVADEMYVRAQAVGQVTADVPAEEKFRMLGKREDEIPALVAALKTEKAEEARQAQALMAAQGKTSQQADPKSQDTGTSLKK